MLNDRTAKGGLQPLSRRPWRWSGNENHESLGGARTIAAVGRARKGLGRGGGCGGGARISAGGRRGKGAAGEPEGRLQVGRGLGSSAPGWQRCSPWTVPALEEGWRRSRSPHPVSASASCSCSCCRALAVRRPPASWRMRPGWGAQGQVRPGDGDRGFGDLVAAGAGAPPPFSSPDSFPARRCGPPDRERDREEGFGGRAAPEDARGGQGKRAGRWNAAEAQRPARPRGLGAGRLGAGRGQTGPRRDATPDARVPAALLTCLPPTHCSHPCAARWTRRPLGAGDRRAPPGAPPRTSQPLRSRLTASLPQLSSLPFSRRPLGPLGISTAFSASWHRSPFAWARWGAFSWAVSQGT